MLQPFITLSFSAREGLAPLRHCWHPGQRRRIVVIERFDAFGNHIWTYLDSKLSMFRCLSYTVDVLKTYQWRRDDMFPQWYICVSAPLKDQYKCHPHNPATGRCVGRGRKNRKLLRKWSMILGQEMSFLLKQDCCTRWLHMFVRFVELYQLVTCLQPVAP